MKAPGETRSIKCGTPPVRRGIWAAWLVWIVFWAGCLPSFPLNVDVGAPNREVVDAGAGARFLSEEGLEDTFWLEIDRMGEPGAVGGYLSLGAHRGALVLLLPGASTFARGGTIGKTRGFHLEFGPLIRQQGYLTWTLATRECGTAYGQGDLADVIEAIDWLDGEGKTLLGVSRVYVIGYSTGATVATLLSRHRDVDAIVAIAGIAEPDQFVELWGLYDLLRRIYPFNEGFCQLGATLDFYGPPGATGWTELDTVERIDELRVPELFVHGSNDLIYSVENTLHLRDRYERRMAEGSTLPAPLEFMILEGGTHFDVVERADVLERIGVFLEMFEP